MTSPSIPDPSNLLREEAVDRGTSAGTEAALFAGVAGTQKSPYDRRPPLLTKAMVRPLIGVAYSCGLGVALINDDWLDRLSGWGFYVVLGVVFLAIMSGPFCIWYSLDRLYAARKETRAHRRMRVMSRGGLAFEQATVGDVYWLSKQPDVAKDPAWQALSGIDQRRVVAAWRGNKVPVLRVPTVVRWLVTAEDTGLLINATHAGMDDEAMVGYLDGGVEERATFEFLVSLAYRPST